jgi:uncharacterized protein (TIGR00255 family)
MTIKSMTGFARADGSLGVVAWHWEVRSVNGRGLDVRMRLPSGYESLEPPIREAVAKYVVRGNVTVSLNADRREGGQAIRLNESALAEVVKAAERIRELTGCALPRADGLIGIKGVLEVSEVEEGAEDTAARFEAMLQHLNEVLAALVSARSAEGDRLNEVLNANLVEIERLVGLIECSPARTPAAVGERLNEQVARLLEAGNGLDPERLHQEAVLLATRVDVEEELKRLRAHIGAARELLEDNGSVGRKFDFLAQEFNREANTVCSKANDVEITRAGLALKTVIDQMREQVQNIE